jgi:SAM-dependent methyltransferase
MRFRRGQRGAFACPVCERAVKAFVPHRGRQDARCPHCSSLERHRAIWLYLDQVSDLRSRRGRLLHFAPEGGIRERLAALPGLTYTTCDIAPGRAELTIDAQDIDLPSGSVDVVLCAHVLEHVPDDRLAMRELRRILASDGWAILQVPIVLDKTDEEPTLTDVAERLRRFGQEDHVRAYGPDYYERLAEAGFSIDQIDLRQHFPITELERFGVHLKLESGELPPNLETELFTIPVCRPV